MTLTKTDLVTLLNKMEELNTEKLELKAMLGGDMIIVKKDKDDDESLLILEK